MQEPKKSEVVRNILILSVLIGVVLSSWLFGHILRYSIPALWHPPVQDADPQIKVGLDIEFEGIRRLAAFRGLTTVDFSRQSLFPPVPASQPAACPGYTYYTSLPAKCRTIDGHLVVVSGVEAAVILTPVWK